MKKQAQSFLIAVFAASLLSSPGLAEIGSSLQLASADVSSVAASEIVELSREGRHFEAVVQSMDTGHLPTVSDKLAAAKSAWALGLVDVARSYWDDALAHRDFRDSERSRAVLARAIMELQEGNHEEARAFAEAEAMRLSPSDLRAQFWLLIAEALKGQGANSLSEQYYKRALEEGGKETADEASYLLGECQYALGLVNDSRYSFASIETRSKFTAEALRRLAEIDLAQRNFNGVLVWVEEARDGYPSDFNDGWTSYAKVTALIETNELEQARKELERYLTKNSDKDNWFALAQAALEAAEIKILHPALSGGQSKVRVHD